MSNNEPPSHVLQWLESIPVLDKLADSKEHEAVQALVGNEGFRLFLGLLLGSRQAFYAGLSAIPLVNGESAARASVIQGQIKGIDLFRQTILESFSSVGEQQGA